MKIRFMLAGVAAVAALALAAAGCSKDDGVSSGNHGGRVASEQTQAGRGRWSVPAQEQIEARPAALGQGAQAPEEPRGAPESAAESTGREVVEAGEPITAHGVLAYEAPEWYLDTAEERYLLHLGNAAFVDQAGIPLQSGAQATVRGFAEGEEMAVTTIEIQGTGYALRTEEGVPLWSGAAGNGRGRGAAGSEEQGGGRGAQGAGRGGAGVRDGRGGGAGGQGGGHGRVDTSSV